MKKIDTLLFIAVFVMGTVGSVWALWGNATNIEGPVKSISSNMITISSQSEDGQRMQEISLEVNDKIKDMVSHASIGGGFNQEGKTHSVNLRGSLTQNIFSEHSSLNNFSQELLLDAQKDLTDYDHLTAHETFTHAEEPLSFEDAFGRTSGHYGSYHNLFDLGYAREITRQWTTKFKYLQSNDLFSREDLSDSVAYTPGMETNYELDSKTMFILGYDYTRRFFDPGADASDHRVSYGLRRTLANLWYLDLKSGIDFINAFDGSDLTEPRYEFALTPFLYFREGGKLCLKNMPMYCVGL